MLIRDYRAGDEAGIMRLLSSLGWTHLASRRSWEWEFQRCPGGPAIIKVAEHDGQIVGHYAGLPMVMQCGDHVILGAKAEGSAVDARYRGKAWRQLERSPEEPTVFRQLVRSVLTHASATGLELVWGFPNAAALTPQVRAGYAQIMIPLRVLVMPLNLTRLLESRGRLGQRIGRLAQPVFQALNRFKAVGPSPVAGVRVSDVPRFDERSTQLWERFVQEDPCVTVRRDARYLNWRFVDNPNVTYHRWIAERGEELVGYLVTSVERQGKTTVGRIVDGLTLKAGAEIAEVLVRYALEPLRTHADWVEMWTVQGHGRYRVYERALRRRGVVWGRRHSLPLIVWAHPADGVSAMALDYRNWYLTMALTEGAH